MNRNPLLGYLMNEKKGDVVHSTGYAKVQSEGRIGTASAESFAARRAIEANRTSVQRYKDSRVANEGGNKFAAAGKFNVEQEAARREAIRERFAMKKEDRSGADRGGARPERRNPGISR